MGYRLNKEKMVNKSIEKSIGGVKVYYGLSYNFIDLVDDIDKSIIHSGIIMKFGFLKYF